MIVVFDLDGTLIDSAPDIRDTVNAILAEESAEPLSLAAVTSFVGNGTAVLMERVIAARGLDPGAHPRLLAQFMARYETAHARTTLYPGAADMLDALATAGHLLGLCTNKPLAPTRGVLQHFGMTGRFGAVIGGDSLAVKKPDAAPLLAVVEKLGGGPALFVGDSEVDAATARAAGLPFALFPDGYRKTPVAAIPHDHLLARHADLPGIVARAALR